MWWLLKDGIFHHYSGGVSFLAFSNETNQKSTTTTLIPSSLAPCMEQM